MTQVKIAVHGGAWNIPADLRPAHEAGCFRAYEAGLAVLKAGGRAGEAVAAAIRIMEDDPTFDAGYGSFLNEDGQVELDAGLMEGHHLESGAVIGVSKIQNPIDLAAAIMGQSRHILFTGEGAHRVAERLGFPLIPADHHIIDREIERLETLQKTADAGGKQVWKDQPGDTVGAVALDQYGNLAAGNSTGGIPQKEVGRIGDAALIGVGFYADNQLAAGICTGLGESIMRAGLLRTALDRLAELGPQAAAQAAVHHLSERVEGFGGILLMTPDGKVGCAYNTEYMARCIDGKAHT